MYTTHMPVGTVILAGRGGCFFVRIQKRLLGLCHQPTGREQPRERLIFKLRWLRESTFLWTEKEADHSSGHETWDFAWYQIKSIEISTSDTQILWVFPFFTQYSLKACLGLRVDSQTVQVNIHVTTFRVVQSSGGELTWCQLCVVFVVFQTWPGLLWSKCLD